MTKIIERERGWGGRSLDERRAARRAQLLEAGLDLVSEGGTQAVTVRAVCRTAKLTERYFYESFTDRETFTGDLYDEVAAGCVEAIVSATGSSDRSPRAIASAAVAAVVAYALEDPRHGRLLFVAPSTDPALLAKRDRMMPVITRLVRTQISDAAGEAHRDLVAASLVGALGNLFLQYIEGSLQVRRDEFVDHCVRLLLTVAAMPA